MHLTRRFFLQSSGALAAYLGISPLELLGRPARPLPIAAVTPGKTLVVIRSRSIGREAVTAPRSISTGSTDCIHASNRS
ncbi:MAG: hypothetical protein ACYTF9_04995 [Planctomycetota bacterium]|jgi:hypothetical protein